MPARSSLLMALLAVLAGTAGEAYAQDPSMATLDAIQVTVQKREEAAKDVPWSLTAFDAQALDRLRVRSINDVARLSANTFFSGSSGVNSLTMRGVGGGGRNVGFDPRVGVYLDGAYVGQAQALTMPWLDLEQVVFLRGPQGHLFGRNSVAGAVVMTSVPPTDSFEGEVRVAGGSRDLAEGSVVVSGPLSDTLRGRVAASQEHQDGYVHNRADGQTLGGLERNSARASLAWVPSDQLEVRLTADTGHLRQTIPYGQPTTDFFGVPLLGPPLNKREVNINDRPFVELQTGGVSLTGTYHAFGGGTFTSITSRRSTRQNRQNDMDYSAADIVKLRYQDRFSQISQEFRWASSDTGLVRSVLGFYAAREDANTQRYIDVGQDMGALVPVAGYPMRLPFGVAFGVKPGLAQASSRGQLRTDTAAVFGSVDWDLSDRWVAELGARYTWEKKDLAMQLDGRGSGALRVATLPNDQQSLRHTDFSPRASLIFRASDAVNAYVTYSTGFKSGGWNVDFLNVAQAASGYGFSPETVRSWEVGLKGEAWDRRLSFEVAAFRARYEDFQVFQFVTLGSGTSALQLRNAAQATSEGVEASLALQATSALRVGLNAGLLRAQFDRFPNGDATGRDLAGNDLPEAPRQTVGAQVDYRLKAGRAGWLDWHLDHSYRGSWFSAATNTPNEKVRSSQQTNASVRFVPVSGRWEVEVWGRNVFDRDVVVAHTRDFFGNEVVQYNAPRSVGITATWHF